MPTAQENLDALKAECLEDETEEQHAVHKDALEAAYAAFARAVASNPAPQGETTQIDAAVVVSSDAQV